MTVIATDATRLSNLVKHELWPETGYCRKEVIVNEAAAKSYVIGTVLGKVTADGKYRIAVQTAVDGSAVAAAIVVEAKSIPATTDTKVIVYTKGPLEVSRDALVLDATYNLDAEKAQVYADLEAKGINVLVTI